MAISTRFKEVRSTYHSPKFLVIASLLLTCLFIVVFSKPLLYDDLNQLHHPPASSPPSPSHASHKTASSFFRPNKPRPANANSDATALGHAKTTSAPKKLHPKPAEALLPVAVDGDRPLVVYAYAESENARDSLKFFVARALHARAEFIFIFNGETDAETLVPKHLANVRFVKRPNTCYDLGAFGEVLGKDDLWKKYRRFITINASVRGPFLPMWSDDCWTDLFLDRITDEVKLVGLTLSCEPVTHVQSMLYATDAEGMRILMDPALAHSVPLDTMPWGGVELPVGFTGCYPTHEEAIHAEIGITRLIQSQGYKVDVMLTSVHASSPEEHCNPDRPGYSYGDPNSQGHYGGSNIHPYEVIFTKANRGIDDALLISFTEWHTQMNETSWEKCTRRAG